MHRFDCGFRLIQTMIGHDLIQEAADLLSGPVPGCEYPFGMVGLVLAKSIDDAARVPILRAAIRVWRSQPPDAHRKYDFLSVFANSWRLLPVDEATEVTREIVQQILEEPDESIHAGILPESNGVEFTSRRQFRLFELLNVLVRLMPETIGSLLPGRPELAAAVARFPLGMESVMAEPRSKRACPPGGGFGFVGHPDDIPAAMAMLAAERERSTDPHFEEAFRLYREDTVLENLNRAPRECWPSTQAYRHALYIAGKLRGAEAAAYLERVPDPDLRLLAQIELAAALAGLPEWSGVRTSFHPGRFDRTGS